MLIVFRSVFPAPFTPGAVRSFGSGEVGPPPTGVVGRESCPCDGARSPLFGRVGVEAPDLKSDMVGMPPVLFRVLFAGSAGRAAVGGPKDGLEGRGSDAAILNIVGVR